MTSSARAGFLRGSTGFIARAVIQLCLMAVTIVATRRLAVVDFGAFAIASAMMLLARNLFYVGPYEFYLKSREEPLDRRTCLAANCVLAIVSTLVLGVFAFWSQTIFGMSSVRMLLLAMMPALFLAAWTSIYEAELLRQQRVTLYYIFTVIGELVGTAAAIGFLVAGVGPLALISQIYGRLIVLNISYAVVVPKVNFPIAPPSRVRMVLAWSWSRYGATFLNFFSNYGADLVLGALITPAATGIYRAGNRIVSALTDLFVQPLFKMAQANVSARVARGLPVDDSWLMMFKGGAAVAWAALAALAMTAPSVIPWLLGAQWEAAAPVVQLFCVFKASSLLDATTTSLLIALNQQRYTFRVQAAVCVVSVVAVASLAPFGILAVVIGSGTALFGLSVALVVRSAMMTGTSARHVLATIGSAARAATVVVVALAAERAVAQFYPGPHGPAGVWISGFTAVVALGVALWFQRRELAQSFSSLGATERKLGVA